MEKTQRKKLKRVVVAMSGGVDSSVAAALLKKQNYQVVGVFMKFWKHSINNDINNGYNKCCSLESEIRARKTAEILNIPFYVFNFEKEFKKIVVDYFIDSYRKGLTPNPCVVCNKKIKFGLFLEKALKINADYIATGHYVRKIEKNFKNKEFKLLKGKDKNKDQSYFLWQLSQKELEKTLFPLGNYTKDQVKQLAEKFELPVSGISESMEVCFIKNKTKDFLSFYLENKPGPILSTEKKEIGRHQGLYFYTLGQRKGIKISGGPFYVANKDLKKNALIVTSSFSSKVLYRKKIEIQNVNWVKGKKPNLPLKVKAQTRYSQKLTSAVIKKTKNYEIVFDKPQKAIAFGQSAVFYQGQELLGGGIISK